MERERKKLATDRGGRRLFLEAPSPWNKGRKKKIYKFINLNI